MPPKPEVPVNSTVDLINTVDIFNAGRKLKRGDISAANGSYVCVKSVQKSISSNQALSPRGNECGSEA